MTKNEHIAEAERLAAKAAAEGSSSSMPTHTVVLALVHAQIAVAQA